MGKIITLIDIGAAGGFQKRWKNAKNLRVVGFEPEKEAFEKLRAEITLPNIILNAALHKEAGHLDFYVTQSPTDSSILKSNSKFTGRFSGADRFKIASAERISVDTLDNQLSINNIADVDFIKLDTQGSELFILEGGRDSLNKAFGIEIECEFQEIYEGQPVFRDVDSLLNKFGFRIHDLRNFYWKRKAGRFLGMDKGQLVYAEALYFKDLEFIPKDKNKVAMAIEICLVYGYADYAMEILDHFSGVFDANEITEYKSKLNNLKNFDRHKIFQNTFIYNTLLRLAKFFKPPLWKGVSWNDELGNLE